MTTMGLPRIKLSVESYKHKQFGHIQKPKFSIIGWYRNEPESTAEEFFSTDDYCDTIPDGIPEMG